MSLYLYVRADFDENGLNSETFTNLDDFVSNQLDDFENFVELENYIKECAEDEEEPEYHPKHVYDLITNGYAEGEWDSEEFFEIKGTITSGIS